MPTAPNPLVPDVHVYIAGRGGGIVDRRRRGKGGGRALASPTIDLHTLELGGIKRSEATYPPSFQRVNMAWVSGEMERFQAGDPDAIRALYREYGGAVHTVAISIVHDRELAADVVQQTFVKAWRAAASFERGREVAPWLYAIARHTAIDALRSEARPTRGGHEPEVEVQVDSESMEATWERFEVRRAIDTLPADEREVVRRSHLLGHTHEEIAQQLGVPIGTVKSRSSRAHKRLAVALAHLQAEQPAANQSQISTVLIDEERR